MAGTSGCSHQSKRLKLTDTSCLTRESKESERLTATASNESMEATRTSGEDIGRVEVQIERSKAHWSMLADESGAVRGEGESEYVRAPASDAVQATTSATLPFVTAVEEQIERSKVHWSVLADHQSSEEEDEEVAEVSNVEEFKALQMHPRYGTFFQTFGYDFGINESVGELVIGEKFAEGGQAEIYEAQVKWLYPSGDEGDLNLETEHLLKVFKKGTFLKHLQLQVPCGLLHFHLEEVKNSESSTPVVQPRFCCEVYCGLLLKDGRFAFLMRKEHGDLRNLIEHNMELKMGDHCGPFSRDEAEYIMYCVALGVNWLHNHNIVHKDLKASNVLFNKYKLATKVIG